MDVWNWVMDTRDALRAEGQHRLVDLIDEMPSNVCAGRTALVSAALPEALAAARAIPHPWLEVFFRHWEINGRASQDKQGETALKDAVSLFEFAHRKDTIDCPQTICTTQDIAIVYGNVDGEGYAPERMAVCEETLGRIDPGWNCFDCISRELVEAFIDAGRGAEAAALAERQMDKLRAAGSSPSSDFHTVLARAQFAGGDAAAALKTLEQAPTFRDQDIDRFLRDCLRFRILAGSGHHEEALRQLPSQEYGAQFGENLEFVRGVADIVAAMPEVNAQPLVQRLAAALRRYDKAGAHRMAIQTADIVVRLAVARKARRSAEQALAIARPHLDKLRAPLGAAEQLAALDALVAAMPVAALPVPADQLLDHINGLDSADPERDLVWCLAAVAHLPDDAPLASGVARAMWASGERADGIAYLWQFVRSHPALHSTAAELLWHLIDTGDQDGVAELAAVLQSANPALAHWCRAKLAFARQAWLEVGPHVASLLALDPEAHQTKGLWAEAALHAKQFDQALRLSEELAEREAEPGNAHWDAMVAASAARRWDVVRALAARLQFALSGSAGVVEEEWELLRMRFTDGERIARRTGPVTARILALTPGRELQRVRDWVVFAPAPLEPVPDDEAVRANFIQSFQVEHVLEEGGFGSTWYLAGVHPGEPLVAAIKAALDAAGCVWEQYSDEDSTVYVDALEEELPALSLALAAPLALAPAALHAQLSALTAGLEHPLHWPGLAEAAGSDVERHAQLQQRYWI